MIIERMIEAGMREFKENLERFCGTEAERALTPESAQVITRGIQQAIAAAGRGAFRAYCSYSVCPVGNRGAHAIQLQHGELESTEERDRRVDEALCEAPQGRALHGYG